MMGWGELGYENRHDQGRIQVLWGLKLVKFLGPSLRKRIRC